MACPAESTVVVAGGRDALSTGSEELLCCDLVKQGPVGEAGDADGTGERECRPPPANPRCPV